ncbi:MAG: hypothetical protein COZ85_01090 [Candidatus Moranbacteria bacterium CG_4_8_14_3_um_filter_34_16]|nr:MAG: hypothetical protein COT31_01840 [Candidatus Moranbacteria bacterium CG08_land_8_20_14_0_20_34_16]PIW95226.1 MAG: hypothetical protein COZ85_01090 [Candidatus Moranbacteria bacterium CG_4_8_14_3_um_filter_34_16]PJA89367.1 MAG: hypothetical protein CO138_00785 [Candidatus Moranbacteria bacterium CG_4_9_14_3_um_filter_33_15]
MFLILGRTIKESFINFWRNGWLSVVAVSNLTLSLYVVGFVLTILIVTNGILKSFEDRMNISVYFQSDVAEEKIMEIKKEIESQEKVALVEYISKDKALEEFKKNNANEPAIMNSLNIIGENPLLASLVIKADSSIQYEKISDYIGKASFRESVVRTNYSKNKEIISKLNGIIFKVKKSGLALATIFGFISAINIFNTVRIAIYTRRQEIGVMRLVGASNMFIRLPIVFEGVFYGIVASVLGTMFLFFTAKFGSPFISSMISGENLLDVFKNNLNIILGVQMVAGVFLGIFSSWIAIRKYLKV